MRKQISFSLLGLTVMAGPGSLLAGTNVPSVSPAPREVTSTLKSIRSQKAGIARHFDAMYRRVGHPLLFSLETHVDDLNSLRAKINRLGSDLTRLESAALSPAQQAAVSELRSSLVPIAAGLDEALRKLNQNQLVFRMPGYYEELRTLARQASAASASVNRTVAIALNTGSAPGPSDAAAF